MAVAANTYGTVERVQRLIGDLIPGRAFSLTTNPTLAEVEGFLDDAADFLNMELKAAGYTVPVALATDPETFRYLRLINSAGAAWFILNTKPAEAFSTIATEQQVVDRRTAIQNLFQAGLDKIKDEGLPATRTDALGSFFKVGSQTDADGKTKKPIFTRAMTDFPSSRSLVEE